MEAADVPIPTASDQVVYMSFEVWTTWLCIAPYVVVNDVCPRCWECHQKVLLLSFRIFYLLPVVLARWERSRVGEGIRCGEGAALEKESILTVLAALL